MSSASYVATTAIAVREANFRKYLIACEYLQIDPGKVHESDFIKTRIETVRSQWGEPSEIEKLKKLNKSLKWLEKKYFKVTKKRFYNFAKRCDKLVHKEKLKIHDGSINETYVKCDLSQKNYDFYSRNVKKRAFIIIGVVLVIILLIVALGIS